jgi:long-chain acyl-CoA synthetase
MQGYYKKPQETAGVLSEDGWLNTGDLVMFTYDGEFRVVGRSKDTIVLLGGENIEPEPIESTIAQSDYVDQVMVVGQDQKFLGALIYPNEDKMLEFAREREIEFVDQEELYENEQFRAQINREIQERVNAKNGFKAFEQVFRFHILSRPFEVGEELTQTLKIKRPVVYEKYEREIGRLFA